MSDNPADKSGDAEKRDAVLRRMLATPKLSKGGKKGAEAKPAPGKSHARGPKPVKAGR